MGSAAEVLYYHMAKALASFRFKLLDPNSGYKAQRERKRACGRDTAGEAQVGLKVSNEEELLKEKYEAKVVAFEEKLLKELETNVVAFSADCGRFKEEKLLKEYEAKVVDFAANCGRLKEEEALKENEAKRRQVVDFVTDFGRLCVSLHCENSPEFSVLVCFSLLCFDRLFLVSNRGMKYVLCVLVFTSVAIGRVLEQIAKCFLTLHCYR